MIKKTSSLAASVVFGVVALAGAEATADSYHERINISEISEGGEVVGFKLGMTLRLRGLHDKARIGILPQGALQKHDAYTFRLAAAEPSEGSLLHQFPEVRGLGGQPQEVSFEVRYADVPKLEPGSNIEIVSAWNTKDNLQYWHVYGATTALYSQPHVFTLPAAKRPATARLRQRAGTSSRRLGRFAVTRGQRLKSAAARPRATTPPRPGRAARARRVSPR